MIEGISDAGLSALAGFAGGIVLGLAARMGRFCTLGAIEDYLYQGCDRRLRMWVLAIAVAGLASFVLVSIDALTLHQTLYLTVPFSPLASILGGLMFGYGMSLAGSCGFGALARSGGGDLRAVVIVLVMGIAAYMAISGPLAAARLAFVDATQIDTDLRSLPDVFARMTGAAPVGFGFLFSGGLLILALWSDRFRQQHAAIAWAVAVGLAVAWGWAATQWVANNGFGTDPVRSFTFTAPLGETLLFVMTSSGGGLTFTVGSVFGVLAGAFAGSLLRGHFRWEACEDARELRRQCLGAICMGFGAVLAFGCTIGQGISAFSVFALSAPLTFAAIFAGSALGLRQLITGFATNP